MSLRGEVMKLIKKSEVIPTTVEVPAVGRTKAAVDKLLGRPTPSHRFVGRRTFGNCFVQYDFMMPGGDFPIGAKKEDVVFGTELYQGLFPIRHHGHRVYECRVDNISTVKIGTINLED
jgi:hypothetical protein